MQLLILTPNRKVFEGDIQQITLPGSAGPFQVLKGHAPLLSTLQRGTLTYQDGERVHTMAVEEGTVEVLEDVITVLLPQGTKKNKGMARSLPNNPELPA